MLNGKSIAVVVPAFNEQEQIAGVIETMPDFVDRIIVVNDCSTDKTADVVKDLISRQECPEFIARPVSMPEESRYNWAEIVAYRLSEKERRLFTPFEVCNADSCSDRIVLINHLQNAGVGAAIATGYKWCKDHQIDCTAVMAGDGQMDPDELQDICRPVIEEGVDYVKGNRLIHRSAWLVVPKVRFIGNSILSLLTKIASGYWHVSDTQTGYTAISRKAINAIRLHKIYKSYGMPNDMLVKLNIAFCTLREVEIKPIYRVGEQSKMKIFKVIPRISLLLTKCFFHRLFVKYLFRDFHPLFLLYLFSFLQGIATFSYLAKILGIILAGHTVPTLTFLAFIFLFTSGFQSLLFAMWMDIQDNERLYK